MGGGCCGSGETNVRGTCTDSEPEAVAGVVPQAFKEREAALQKCAAVEEELQQERVLQRRNLRRHAKELSDAQVFLFLRFTGPMVHERKSKGIAEDCERLFNQVTSRDLPGKWV